MNKRVKIACNCSHKFHFYPEDSIVIDSAFGNDDPEDWWIQEECKKCKNRTYFGGESIAGKWYDWGERVFIWHPDYHG